MTIFDLKNILSPCQGTLKTSSKCLFDIRQETSNRRIANTLKNTSSRCKQAHQIDFSMMCAIWAGGINGL